MRHRIIYTFICALAILFTLGACQEEDMGGKTSVSNYLTLELQTRAISRVPENGEDRFNENKIARVDVFFFDKGDEASCLYAQTGLIPQGNTLQVELDRDILQDGNYDVYAVANYDIGVTEESAKGQSLSALKNKTVFSDWKTGDEKEESLVMDGSTTVTLNSEGASGHVDLTRAMAKVMLYVTTENQIEINGMTYTPIASRMSVEMYNSVTRTNLAGTYSVQETDYKSGLNRAYNANNPDKVTIDNKEYNQYEQIAPFYSYPNPESNANRQNSYLLLCVPWMASESGDAGGSYQALNYYYRVPITDKEAAILERNHYYKINVHIGVLGALDPAEAVEITSDYEILDWFSTDIDAEMQQYRYLVLDDYQSITDKTYESVMNNTNELRVPYISSSNLDFDTDDRDEYYTEITKVTYMNYNDPRAKDNGYASTVTLTGEAISRNGFSVREEEGELVFTHPISSEDYVPYTITVKVQNDQGLAVEWEITQYPAIYIVGDYNPDGFENNWGNESGNRFVYGVLDGYVGDDYNNSLGNVNDPTVNATNKNLNQYTIYITSFDIEGSDYAIGDPRSFTVDNLSSSLDNKRDSHNKLLASYYPTRKDDVSNVIAPAFKIASSWGVVSTSNGGYGSRRVLSYETAQRRCASYQENGYPAGRWRIPTEAEIEYIVSLSDREVIPALFNGDYYASSGRYYHNGYVYDGWGGGYIDPSLIGFHDDTNTNIGHSVRCVYDVWYWGNGKIEDPTKFTWGDEPRQ